MEGEGAGASSAAGAGDQGQEPTGRATGGGAGTGTGTGAASGAAADAGAGGGTQEDPRVAQARQEAITERKARQTAEAALKKLQDAALSDTERKDKRLSELEAENATMKLERQTDRIAMAATAVARQAGALYPEQAWKLLTLSEVEFDAGGNPTNLPKLVDALKKASPALFRGGGQQTRLDQGARTNASTKDRNDQMRELLGIPATSS